MSRLHRLQAPLIRLTKVSICFVLLLYTVAGIPVNRSKKSHVTQQENGRDGNKTRVAPLLPSTGPGRSSLYSPNALLFNPQSGGAQNVIWTNLAGVTVSANSLTKTAGNNWGNAGAVSGQAITSGDGYVEFTASEASTWRMGGLSRGDSDQNYTDIDFAIYPTGTGSGNVIQVYESGVYRGDFGTYTTGDRLRVAVESGLVKYSRNGTVLYTSTVAPSYPLLVDTSLYSNGSTLTNVIISGNLSSNVQNVAWTNMAGVTVSANTLTKTAGNNWGNAGAVSGQAITSGDGYVEFTASETSTWRMGGLSRGDSDQNYTDIDFAIYPTGTGSGNVIQVYESGVYRGDFGTYTTGDRLRVAVESGLVKYSKNGTVLYTSTVAPSYPLLVDTSLYSNGSTLTNVIISGNLSSNVTVFDGLTNATIVNLALQKSATQSSIDSGNSADRAVDGNSGTFAQTLSEVHPWWQVDLGEIGYIDKIQISTRADCCATDFRSVFVFTSEVPFVSNDMDATFNQPEVTSLLGTLIGGGSSTTVDVQRSARYVRVQVRPASPLNLYLAEVQVMGIRVPPNSPAATGQWSAVLPLHNTVDAASVGHTWNSLSVVHLSVLPSKKLLFWGRDKLQSSTGTEGWFDDTQGGSDAYLWDMTRQDDLNTPQDERLTLIRNTTTNLFCAGHSFLPNGDLFVAGGDSIPVDNTAAQRFDLDGHGVTQTNIFDWKLEKWFAGPNMRQPRWYPSLLTLSDGQSLIMSGSFVTFDQQNNVKGNQDRDTEILTRDRTLQRKGDLPVDLPNYPFAHLSPDGRAFVVSGTSNDGLFYNPSTGSWTPPSNVNLVDFHDQGTSVMYDRGKIIVIGGRTNTSVSRNTEMIDFTGTNPQWNTGTPMHFERYYATPVLMPDGKIFIIGGSKCTGANNLQTADGKCRNGAVMYPEIYDPDPVSPSWSVMARQSTVRMYHSVALLLPDARIMVAGGGRPGAFGEPGELKYLAHHEVEIFSPPYLFNANGSLATRPVVTSNPPDSIIYGQTFNIGVGNFTASEIQQVVLVRLPSVTHVLNFDQQRVVLTKQIVDQQTLTLTAPANGTYAAPGPYMLFVIGPNGAPSKANIVLLDNTQPPPPPPLPLNVTVSPSTPITLFGGQNQQFSAIVTGASNTGVTWSISPVVGSINTAGLYVAPNPITANQTITVKACSVVDTNRCGTNTVNLVPLTVAVTPKTPTLLAGQTVQFNASVSGATNTAVTWSLSPATAAAGSIDAATGLYTAPSVVSSVTSVTVTARSAANSSISDQATVTLRGPAVTLAPSTINFGGLPLGATSAGRTVTLTNTGAATLSIAGISRNGDFAIATNNCASSLAAGASCTITLTFTPTAVGLRTGTLTVNDNAFGSPHVVSLSGSVLQGYHDIANCEGMAGWAWDSSQPNTPITVYLYEGTRYLGSAFAGDYRPDLAGSYGNGYHGFAWGNVLSLLDGATHSVSVHYAQDPNSPLLNNTPRTISCSPSVNIAWIQPSAVSWGPANTLTAAGFATQGSGNVTLQWRDVTLNGPWNTVPYQAPTNPNNGGWSNTIPSADTCHVFQAIAQYSGVSASGSYNGVAQGYCSFRVIWIQPQSSAGFGPPGSLVIAGSAQGGPSGALVTLWFRDDTAQSAWTPLSYQAPTDANGIWYNAIENVNYTHQYSVYITYDNVSSGTCSYHGNNQATTCP